MTSILSVEPSETEVSLSRTVVDESYPVALGYTDDNRHIILDSATEGLRKGDELVQVNMLDITHISHRDLLQMILPTKLLLLTVRRYPTIHSKASFSTVSCANAIGTKRHGAKPQVTVDTNEARWASSPSQIGLAGWHSDGIHATPTSQNPPSKKITVIGDDLNPESDTVPRVDAVTEGRKVVTPKEKKLRRRSQELDRRLPITIGSPINFEHREHMTKQQATVAVEKSGNIHANGSPTGSQSPSTVPVRRSSAETFPYRRAKLSRRLSQNLEHRMVQIGSPMNFQHLEHVSAADVDGVLPARNDDTAHAAVGGGRTEGGAWTTPEVSQQRVDDAHDADPVLPLSCDAEIRQSPNGRAQTETILALDRQLRDQLSELEQDGIHPLKPISSQSSADSASSRTDHPQPKQAEEQLQGLSTEPLPSANGTATPSLSALQALARDKLAEAHAYITKTETELATTASAAIVVDGDTQRQTNATSSLPGVVPIVSLGEGDHTKVVTVHTSYDPATMSKYDNTDDELPLVAGQIVMLFGACGEDGYYVGQVDGRRGLVPAAYLSNGENSDTHTKDVPTPPAGIPTVGSSHSPPIVRRCIVMRVVREYVPSTMSPFRNHEDEIAVVVGQTAVVHGTPGDDGYVVAEVNGKCGLVPHNVLAAPAADEDTSGHRDPDYRDGRRLHTLGDGPGGARVDGCVEVDKSALENAHAVVDVDKSALENAHAVVAVDKSALDRRAPAAARPAAQRVEALYAYHGRKRSELTFAKGAHFDLLHETSAEWWKVCDAHGHLGYVPANYVAKVNATAQMV
eukprot:m.1033102 g.1033102  ORF g.1033102 m.1033102 type:complete len:800 (+) comp24130_c0_seq5:154-2553(+)